MSAYRQTATPIGPTSITPAGSERERAGTGRRPHARSREAREIHGKRRAQLGALDPREVNPARPRLKAPGTWHCPVSGVVGLVPEIPAPGLLRVWGGGGRDRPEAACPPGSCAAVGEAGGFNAVQKLLTRVILHVCSSRLRALSSDG